MPNQATEERGVCCECQEEVPVELSRVSGKYRTKYHFGPDHRICDGSGTEPQVVLGREKELAERELEEAFD